MMNIVKPKFIACIILVFLLNSCYQNTVPKSSNESNLLNPTNLDSIFTQIRETSDATFALQLTEEIIPLANLIKDSTTLGEFHRLIGHYFIRSRDYERAESHLKTAELILKQLHDWEGVMYVNKNLARVYRGMKKTDTIEKFLKDNIDRVLKTDRASFGELYLFHELAVHYNYDLGKHKEAITYGELFLKRLAHYDSPHITNFKFLDIKQHQKDVIYLTLGDSYTHTKQFNKALPYLNKALINYTQRKDPEKIIRVHKALFNYYLFTNNTEKLLYHKDKYFEATETFISGIAKSEKNITEYKLKSAKDEQALIDLKEENKLKSILTYVIIGMLTALTLFQWRNSKLRREKQEVASQLEKQYEFNKFKTNLLITIAHELRTPLTLILGNLQFIASEKMDSKKFNSYIDKIKQNSQSILDKMSDIIHLVKEDKTIPTATLQNINILPYLKGFFFGFEGMAKIKQIQLIFNAELPSNYTFKTDTKILDGLLSNLIVNAIKYSHSNSEIKLNVSATDDNLIIKVIDYGIGISEANQAKIFDMFNRILTETVVDGFGIGLAIAKDLTMQLNGKIEVESKLNKGSAFTLTLPNKKPIAKLGQESLVTSEAIKTNKQTKAKHKAELPTLLIAEDNPEMCSFYKQIFSPLFNCTFAFNGLEAYNKIKDSNYDIILSDVMMPEMDGFELKEKVRTLTTKKHIPFIMVTAKDEDQSKIKAFNIGVDDYIIKPFNIEELIARINALMRNKHAREKWSSLNEEATNLETNTYDLKTVKKMQKIVLANCSNDDFSVTDLASEIGLSQRQLVRVIKKLTGLTPVKFILEVRMLEAYKKIKNQEEADINNVRFAIGLQSASYFSTQFKKRFGLNPTELVKNQKNDLIHLE